MDVSLLLNADTASDASPMKEEVNQNWVMVGQVQDVDIDIKHEQRPYSNQGYVNHLIQADSDRRSSTSSFSVSSTASSPTPSSRSVHRTITARRRVNEICKHLQQPYPTPGSTPVPEEASKTQPKKRKPPRKREEITDPVELARKDAKAERERDNRDEIATFLSLIQLELTRINPKFPEVAMGSGGHGWTRLKKHNVSQTLTEEVTGIKPFNHNKDDLLATTLHFLNQIPDWSSAMLERMYALDPEFARQSEDGWKKLATAHGCQATEQMLQLVAKLREPGYELDSYQ